MQHSGKNLDAVLLAFLEHAAIVRDSLSIGLRIVAIGKDAAPTDGCAEDLHTHLSKQSDVLFVVMVKIDAAAVGVVGSVHILQCLFKLLCREGTAVVFGLYLFPIPAGIQIPQILGGYSFAPVPKAAFCLGAGDCTAPQKTFLKSLFHA